MRDFQFHQRCHSNGTVRAADTVAFLMLMKEAFGRSGWIDADDDEVELTVEYVDKMLCKEKRSEEDFQRFGVTWVGKSKDHSRPVLMVSTDVGGSEYSPNGFSLDFCQSDELPNLDYFRRSIEIVRPYDASIHSVKHSYELIDRLPKPRVPRKDHRPTAIYWFHYLDEQVANTIGGISKCLDTPCFNVEPFVDGVLFQLTEEAFEATNEEHLAVQRRAMQHLGIPTYD